MTHRPGHVTDAGFVWADYVDWITAAAGSLAAAADRLCAHRGYKDDVASVERALRRLRRRGSRDGGTWGARALALFGLPGAVEQRVRWLGQYHARFTDLPVPVCADLVRAWDRPPTTESRDGRAWLALGHASLALRRRDDAAALVHLDRARADLAAAVPAAQLEALLARAYAASRAQPTAVGGLLADVGARLAAVTDAHDRACLEVRWIDHRAYDLNARGDHAGAEALYQAVSTDGPAFVGARRAAGLAYARWKQGAAAEAGAWALAAAERAGDGGHLRARAMALDLYARITGDDDARRRAQAISQQLEDETLLARFSRARS